MIGLLIYIACANLYGVVTARKYHAMQVWWLFVVVVVYLFSDYVLALLLAL
jgi:hypothetical protein